MAKDGVGTTITFGTSGFSARIIDAAGPNQERGSIDATHMESEDYMEFVEAELVDGGSLDITIEYAVAIQLWGQGTGKLMRDGQVYDIQWVRENAQTANDRLVILDSNGNQIPFRPGPTWIQLVRPDGNVQIQ